MKYATFILVFVVGFAKSYSQNEVTYCQQTIWTKDSKGLQIDSYGVHGVLRSIMINRFGDTTQIIQKTYDDKGRKDTVKGQSIYCHYFLDSVEINPYKFDTLPTGVSVQKERGASGVSRTIYDNTSKIVVGYEVISPDSSYVLYNKSIYNSQGDEIFDGYYLYAEYIYDQKGRDSIVTEIDSLDNNKSVGYFKYDHLGQCVEIVVKTHSFEGSDTIVKTNSYEYDKNGNQTKSKTITSDGYVDQTFNEYNETNVLTRSYGFDNHGYEWEMLFERIPCNNE